MLILSSLYFIYGANWSQTLLDKTIEFNNKVYEDCFQTSFGVWQQWDWLHQSGSSGWSHSFLKDTDRYRESTDCWKSQRKLTSDDLFLTVPKSLVDNGQCAITQTEDEHVSKVNGGMYATDLACKFEDQVVHAPDYLDKMIEYKIESVWVDTLLWNFVILSFPDWGTMDDIRTRWYFWHTVLDSKMKVWDTVSTWVRFAHADLSGATTGWHTHIELRRMYDGVWQSVRYVTRGKERKLEEKRLWSMSGRSNNQGTLTGNIKYYFTHYTFVKAQTDDAPCISASGDDVCKMKAHGIGTMALTVDIRNKMGIKFWDKVALTGDVGCEWVYTVTDEMACRFRGEHAWSNGPCYYSDRITPTPKISNVLRPGTPYFIKGDLPGRPGGACKISKL